MRLYRRSRQRGSALLVALIMIVVTLSMIGLLLAAPEAQLKRTAAATAKERANEIADAGFRDAIMFLNTYELVLKNTWCPQPTTLGGIPKAVWISGATLPSFAGDNSSEYNSGSTTPAQPTTGTHFYGRAVVSGSGNYPNVTSADAWTKTDRPASMSQWKSFWDTQMLPEGFFKTDNFKEFGDPRIVRGRYAYMLTPRGKNYWRIDVEGQAQDTQSRGGLNDKLQVSTRITAFVWKEMPEVNIPGAATFMNPTNAASPTNLFNTQAGGNPPSIVGLDRDNVSDIPGVALQTPNQNIGDGAAEIQGSPNPIVGGSTGNPVSAQTWIDLDAFVARIRVAPEKTSTPVMRHITYPETVPDGWTGTYHLTVPAGMTITTPLLTISGNSPINGIVVLDVGPGVTFETAPIYQKNGTSGFYGSFIFYQQGAINTPAEGLNVIDKNGNNDKFLQYDTSSVTDALLAISAGYKIASYVIK